MTPQELKQTYKLRLQGMSWAQLATKYDTTPEALRQELADWTAAETPPTPAEETARLDFIQAGLWNSAISGNPVTAAEVREIIALRTQLTPHTTRIAQIRAEYD